MQVDFSIANADNKLINALKSVIKLYPDAKAKVKIYKEPNDKLLEAIKEVEKGEVVTFTSHDEAMEYLDAND